MPKSLTKRFIKMAALDQGSRLLAELGEGADPRDFHIEGDLLPLRCAMYGSIDCLLSMMRARPDLAEELAAMADGNGERAIDWAAGSADERAAREIAQLAPLAAAAPSAQGHWPLARALSCGRWEAAAFWLELSPQSALLAASWKRGALHLAAEPGWERQRLDGQPPWSPPPSELAARLAELGANPAARNEKGHTALSRAIASGNRAVFDACLGSLPDTSLPLALAGPPDAFGAVGEAVWHGRVDMLEALAARGARIDEVSSKGFDAMHVAIRRDSREAAEALHARGWRFDSAKGISTTSACSAMASTDPEGWLAWLSARGCDLGARDDLGAHWAELAWERLPFDRARSLWEGLGDGAPRRASRSMLGPVERAARSKIEPRAKLEWLLSNGFLPARLDTSAAAAAGKSDARDQLEQCKSDVFRARAFGISRLMELGPMWSTEPDLLALAEPTRQVPAADSANAWADQSFDDEPASRAARSRPSLLAYAARHAGADVVGWLIQWDEASGHWSDADRLCAWREAVAADASLPTLRILKELASSRGIEPWGPDETSLSIDRLGPAKGRELGAPLPSCGSAILASLAARPQNAGSLLLRDAALFSGSQFHSNRSERLDAEHALMAPWSLAAGSEHSGAIKALLPLDAPLPGLACAYAAMACAQADKGDLVAWVGARAKALARAADPSSPWGRDPSRALALWDEQIRHEGTIPWERALAAVDEATRAKMLARSPAPGADSPDSSISAPLLCALIDKGSLEQARALVEGGIPAPASFRSVAESLCKSAAAATGIGQGNQALEELRALVDSMCARDEFRRVLNFTGGSPILAGVPDPALFDSLLAAGASPGSGPDNAFVRLCERFAGRLSPAFAERLAQGSRDVCPERPLAVAAALATMKPADRNNLAALGPTAAARARLERASRGVDALAWFVAYEDDRCPVGKALGAGSSELALDLAEQAPADYAERAGASWPSLWIGQRLRLLGSAFMDKGAPGAAALDLFASELGRLGRLGAGLGRDPAAEAAAFCSALTGASEPARCLSWLLAQGWRPTELIESSQWSYELSRRLGRALPDPALDGEAEVRAPLLCAALAADRNAEAGVDLALAWSRLGLPAHIVQGKDPLAPAHAALRPEDASTFEARLLAESLPSPATRPPARSRL